MRKPPRARLCGLFGARPSRIALTQNSLHPLRAGRDYRAAGAFSAAGCIRLSAAENNARGLANVCEPWRTALRIMLSATYALCSATSARSRRGFYCRPVPLCEINRVIRKEIHSMHREIGSFAIASSAPPPPHPPAPLFLERERKNHENGITRFTERLTLATRRSRKAKLYVIAFFHGRAVITNVRDKYTVVGDYCSCVSKEGTEIYCKNHKVGMEKY